jgi:hypothetical protein
MCAEWVRAPIPTLPVWLIGRAVDLVYWKVKHANHNANENHYHYGWRLGLAVWLSWSMWQCGNAARTDGLSQVSKRLLSLETKLAVRGASF